MVQYYYISSASQHASQYTSIMYDFSYNHKKNRGGLRVYTLEQIMNLWIHGSDSRSIHKVTILDKITEHYTNNNDEVYMNAFQFRTPSAYFDQKPTLDLIANEQQILQHVRKHGDHIQYVSNQTEENCLGAARNDPWSINHMSMWYQSVVIECLRMNYRAINLTVDPIKEEERRDFLLNHCVYEINSEVMKFPESTLNLIREYFV